MAEDEDKKEEGVAEEAPETVPPEAPPPLTEPVEEPEARQWPPLLTFLVLALIVAALVVLGGRWIYQQVREEPEPQPTPEEQAPPTTQPTPAPTTTPTPAPPSGAPTQNGEITDTGPGDVVAIAIGVSIAAAGLHYIYQLRRAR